MHRMKTGDPVSAVDDLTIWNQRWKLADGCIQCRCCQGIQPETVKQHTFPHKPGCDLALMILTPWAALDSICNRLQTA